MKIASNFNPARAMALGAAGLGAAAALAGVAFVLPAAAHPTIDIVASNWKFTPAMIQVPLGDSTRLRLTSVGGVHGVASDELGIKQTTLAPDKFEMVTFTPPKAGTYVLHCSIVCGPGHPDMVLTIEAK